MRIWFAGFIVLLIIPTQVYALNEKATYSWFENLVTLWDAKLISTTEVDNAVNYMVSHGYVDKNAQNLKSYLNMKEFTKKLDANLTRIQSEFNAADTILKIRVIKCEPMTGGQYLDVGGQITNNDSVTHAPELTYQGIDKNGAIVTFELGFSDDISPGQTVFVDRLITNDPAIDSCRILVNHTN